MMAARVLLVDDEPRSLDAMEMALEDLCEVLRAANGAEALAILAAEAVDLVLTDQRMAGMTGVELLTRVRASHPAITRMIVTGYTDPADMIAAINVAGVERFIQKPWHPEALQQAVLEAVRPAPPGDPFAALPHSPDSPMARVIATARVLARHDVPGLLIGAPGSGRRRLAVAMAAARGQRLASVSGLDEAAVRAALSGPGGMVLIRDADRAAPAVQIAIADALDAAAGSAPQIIATVEDPTALMGELALRLSVEPLHLPPLSARRGDIPLLAEAILARASATHGIATPGFAPGALPALAAADWPGNLHDLENTITRLLLFSDGGPIHAPAEPPAAALAAAIPPAAETAPPPDGVGGGTMGERVAALEATMIRAALSRHRGNKSRAADELGLSRVGLRAKMARYGIEED